MSHIDNRHRDLPPNPNDGAGYALLTFGGVTLLIFAFGSAAAVFAASLAAGIGAVVAVAVAAVLGVFAFRKHGPKSLPFVLLCLTALWAAFGGYIVFESHWLAFTPAAWVLNALFIAALVSGAWSAINAFLKIVSALLAVSLIAATVALPRPPGGDGPLDTAEKWRIDIDVKDELGEPLEGALVLCGAVMRWESALELAETLVRQTDREGHVPTWEFDEDPRLKIVICNAWKNADDGNAGYPPSSQFVFSLAGGGEYQLHFALTENPHPEIAYLTLDLSGDYEHAWYTLKFELWTGEPAGYFGERDGPQPLQAKTWHELRGAGFAVPSAAAGNDLSLRYFYEGPDGEGLRPPYSETRTVTLGPIPPGTRKRLALRIPDR